MKKGNTNEALRALKEEAAAAKCNMQMICRLEDIIRSENFLRNL
jgi:hypothetical protein